MDDDLDDIDALLKACDDLADVPKVSNSGSIQPPALKSNLKESGLTGGSSRSEERSSKHERQVGGNSSKSVRFSHEVEETTPGNTLRKSELADILLRDDRSNAKGDDKRSLTDPVVTSPRKTPSATKNDDWLGLDDSDLDSPFNALDMFSTAKATKAPPPRDLLADDSTPKTHEYEIPEIDTTDLIKMLASGSGKNKRQDAAARKPPVPQTSGRRGVGSLGNSRSQSPVSSIPPEGGIHGDIQSNPRQPVFAIRDPSPDKFDSQRIQPQQSSSFDQFQAAPQQESSPFPTGNSNPKAASSFLESLPFLNKSKEGVTRKVTVESTPGSAGGDFGEPGAPPEKSVTKKKGSGTKSAVGGGVATLQLPSHLVNEEELKVMSSSLKTLYANQLEMLESSYKEQLDFQSLSNKRREELLKAEMTNLQEDYEQRLQRVKAELVKNEGLSGERVQEDVKKLSELVQKLGTKLETVQTLGNGASLDEVKSDMVKEFRRLLENQSEDISRRVGSSLEHEMQKSFQECLQRTISAQSVHLEGLKKRLEAIVEQKESGNSKLLDKMEASERHRQEELQRLMKAQRKISEAGVNSVVDSVLKLFESQKDSSKKKGDRLAVQIKEFRKDLRRLYSDLETRSDSVHKSQFSIEMEQRTITQAVRDINTILKLVTSSSHNNQLLGGGNVNDPNNVTSHYALIQATQMQTQNEMEMKLMKEERKALSDSIAQMNVERRKLGDEKVALERDRLEFDKEKARVRELEMQSKARSMEAEELKRNAESLRFHESQLSQEAEAKMKDLNKEKSRMKERLFEIEQTLRMKEQKLYQDKSDLLKEKEFMDKLRDQLLCPGCLNSSKCSSSSALLNLSAPPPYNSMRSDGDGVELMSESGGLLGQSSTLFSTMPVPKLNLSPDEDAFYRTRNKLILQQIQSQTFTDL